MQANTQGKRIKKIREALKLKQNEFRQIFNCTHAYISAIENDKTKFSTDNLTKLLSEYNVNINYVLAGIGEMFIQPYQMSEESELESKIQQVVLKMKANGLL